MTGGVDQKSAVLDDHNPGDTTDEKSSKSAGPAIPESAQGRWEHKSHEHAEDMNVPVLPHHQRIFLQVGNVIKGWVRKKLEEQPSDMGVKKSL